jgi:uncharacterized protein (DUF433 family)
MNTKEELKKLSLEDRDRIAEGIREFLTEFPELKRADILEALKILVKNYEDSLK